jgi:hypothetical protein
VCACKLCEALVCCRRHLCDTRRNRDILGMHMLSPFLRISIGQKRLQGPSGKAQCTRRLHQQVQKCLVVVSKTGYCGRHLGGVP